MTRANRDNRICSTRLLLLFALACFTLVSSQVGAQSEATEFDIAANNPDLETEYRNELDKWMLRAYEGDPDAQFKVGVLFTNDQFGPPDFEQAVYWYKQAARQGNVLAQYNLGHQYLMGVGVQKSEEKAMQWWLEAAKQDHALAQFNVGRAYYLGIGLPEDHQTSKYWFERAAQNQEPKSIDILQQLGWVDGGPTVDEQAALRSRITPLDSANTGDESNDESSAQATPDEVTTESAITNADADADAQTVAVEDSASNGEAEPSAALPLADETQNTALQATELPTEAAESSPPSDQNLAPSASDSNDSSNRRVIASGIATVSEPEQEPKATETQVSEPQAQKNPLALYTDPSIRSVLIAILDERNAISEVKRSGRWAVVQSAEGFPVWVHGDFIRVNGNTGVVSGQNVNARSVPIVTSGTVVGKLDKDEVVEVVDKRKAWYRIVSPPRFQAWVKVADMDRPAPITRSTSTTVANASDAPVKDSNSSAANHSESAQPVSTEKPRTTSEPLTNGQRPINDNRWMFSQASANYTLQLASFDDMQKVAEFVSRAKFRNNPELHRFTARGKNNTEWTYFLYGSYATRAEAESAKAEINQKLAWVRTFERLQQNRCVAWKTQLPPPQELNEFCTR